MTPEIGLGKCVYLLVGRCTVTLLPNFLGWVDLLSYGAPKRAWSSVNNNNNFFFFFFLVKSLLQNLN